MDNIIKQIGIDSKLYKAPSKIKKFNKLSDQHIIPHTVYQTDLLELPSYKGYKYLLVVTCVSSRDFDIVPIKNKSSETVLKAFIKIITGSIMKKPIKLISDSGSEFKGAFHEYMKENEIYHVKSIPGNHRQTSHVESLNKQIAFILNMKMNYEEEKTGKVNKNWLVFIDFVRDKLNKLRHRNVKEYNPKEDAPLFNADDKNALKEPKFKEGDLVHYRLFEPRNALNQKQPTKQFRVGDRYFSEDKKEIIKVIHMISQPYHRYLLEGIPMSFYEQELRM